MLKNDRSGELQRLELALVVAREAFLADPEPSDMASRWIGAVLELAALCAEVHDFERASALVAEAGDAVRARADEQAVTNFLRFAARLITDQAVAETNPSLSLMVYARAVELADRCQSAAESGNRLAREIADAIRLRFADESAEKIADALRRLNGELLEQPELKEVATLATWQRLAKRSSEGDLIAAAACLRQLITSADGASEAAWPRIGDAAAKLLPGMVEAGEIANALTTYAAVQAAVSRGNAGPQAVRCQIRVAADLIVPLGLAAEVESAGRLFTDIDRLSRQYPELSDLPLMQIRAAADVTAVEAGAGSKEDAEIACKFAVDLATVHPENVLFQEQAVRAVVLLLDRFSTSCNVVTARSFHEIARSISNRFSDHAFLNELQARADAHLAVCEARYGDAAQARQLARRLAGQAMQSPERPVLRELADRTAAEVLLVSGLKKSAGPDDVSSGLGKLAAGLMYILVFTPICLMASPEEAGGFWQTLIFARLPPELGQAESLFEISLPHFALPRDTAFLAALGVAYGILGLIAAFIGLLMKPETAGEPVRVFKVAIAAQGIFAGYILTVSVSPYLLGIEADHLPYLAHALRIFYIYAAFIVLAVAKQLAHSWDIFGVKIDFVADGLFGMATAFILNLGHEAELSMMFEGPIFLCLAFAWMLVFEQIGVRLHLAFIATVVEVESNEPPMDSTLPNAVRARKLMRHFFATFWQKTRRPLKELKETYDRKLQELGGSVPRVSAGGSKFELDLAAFFASFVIIAIWPGAIVGIYLLLTNFL